ncbi:MAG: T9SS type A sorting domain-containing protein, partial [Bacteroidetes bacterium]|nr:T9SS type A sorting domain-containing protein [Bacteroidota bacterium]
LPNSGNQSIIRTIELSGNQVSHPDSLLGYGIPDFVKALRHVNLDKRDTYKSTALYPNPFTDRFTVSIYTATLQEFDAYLISSLGVVVREMHQKAERAGVIDISFSDLTGLPNGNYVLRMVGKDLMLNLKVIKINH